MQTQNYSNHSRYVLLHHFVAAPLILSALIGSFINLRNSLHNSVAVYSAALICVLCVILCLLWFYARYFALKAQDRAIRAEENFRYFIIAGKQLPGQLKMFQTVALRFASDEEFVELVSKAITENLSSKQIKQSVRNWRPDYNRV